MTDEAKPLTAEEESEIRAHADAATPDTVPYAAPPGGAPGEPCMFAVVSTSAGMETARVWKEEDARFYAEARTDISRLLATITAERARVQRLTKALEDLGEIARKINDTTDRSEGDRYYLASTNDWHDLHEVLHRHSAVFLEAHEEGGDQ